MASASLPLALVVEDDTAFRTSLAALVRTEGFDVREAANLADARSALDEREPDLVMLDLELPDGRGLDLKLSDAIPPETPFVVVTGDASAQAARLALREGAADYLTKPLQPGQLKAVLHATLANRKLRDEVQGLRGALRDAGRFGSLVGRSAPMQRVYDLITRVSATAAPVLVTGESGTGKELVASTIHEMSPRKSGAFVAVNCGAIPETLIESKLFGHEKGAFTGADARHQGVFERADGGTLFLDEIGEMPMELQVRLLRVLETSSFTRVGGTEEIRTDVRLVAATNRDPRESIRDGRLREDLFHRLNVFPIHLPPLRKREGDVALLALHFLESLNRAEGEHKRFSSRALSRLAGAEWTGNVRELKNVVHRAWILTAGDVIKPESVRAHAGTYEAQDDDDAERIEVVVGSSLADAERRIVLATLAHCEGNKRKTARVLGVSAKTLYKRLAEYEDGAAS